MLVASLCSLPVGVLRWRGPTPRITVIVKATYAIARDGVAGLSASQLPLSLDVSDPHGDARALWYPSDFVPRKARADVTIVGGAFADPPSALIPVQLLVTGLERRFVARAGAPSPYIPLSESYLHASLARNAATMAVGPRSLAARALGDAAASLDASGLPAARLEEGFDYAAFNAAPIAQQISALGADATITLVGATRDGERRTVRLPGHRPRAFHAGAGGPGATPHEIVLTADTLWIDSFSEVCVLVWRGEIPLAALSERPQEILIALEEGSASWGWPELRAAFASARRDRAIEPVDLGAIPVDEPDEPPGADEDLDGDEPTPMPGNKGIVDEVAFPAGAEEGGDEPPTERPPPPALEETARAAEESTGLLDLASIQRQSALPFGEAPRRARSVEEHTGTIDLAQLRARQATPFERLAPPPPHDDARPRPVRTDALPFAPPVALPPATTPRFTSSPAIESLALVEPTPPKAPIAPHETPLLALETYAQIKAELWRRSPLALPAVAAEHGLTEVEWLTHDLRYIEAIDAQAKEGTSAIAAGVARAMAAAKRAGAAKDDLDLGDYLALKSEIEAAGDAADALKKRGLTRRALRRIERRWQPKNAL